MFEKLYKATERQEAEQEAPLYICGMWFNTSPAPDGSKALDAESNKGGAAIIESGEELQEFLEASGVTPEQIEKYI